jgi:hypothetical protein
MSVSDSDYEIVGGQRSQAAQGFVPNLAARPATPQSVPVPSSPMAQAPMFSQFQQPAQAAQFPQPFAQAAQQKPMLPRAQTEPGMNGIFKTVDFRTILAPNKFSGRDADWRQFKDSILTALGVTGLDDFLEKTQRMVVAARMDQLLPEEQKRPNSFMPF